MPLLGGYTPLRLKIVGGKERGNIKEALVKECTNAEVLGKELELIEQLVKQITTNENPCIETLKVACELYPVFCAIFGERILRKSVEIWDATRFEEDLTGELRDFIKEDVLKWLIRLLAISIVVSYDEIQIDSNLEYLRGSLTRSLREIEEWDRIIASRIRDTPSYRRLRNSLREMIEGERNLLETVSRLKPEVGSSYNTSTNTGPREIYRSFRSITVLRSQLLERESVILIMSSFVNEFRNKIEENFSEEGYRNLRELSDKDREKRKQDILNGLERYWKDTFLRDERWQNLWSILREFLDEVFSLMTPPRI